MSDLVVNVLCRNLYEDRVIPRFSRYLADNLGWTLTAVPVKGGKGRRSADVYYLSCYLDEGLLPRGHTQPVAAYFTHRETDPASIPKTRQFDRLAGEVDLRIATAAMYAEPLSACGPTAQIAPPVERERFAIPARRPGQGGIVAGFSGYTYGNGRKGEGLAKALLSSDPWPSIQWRASGRGWPVRPTRYHWSQMPAFYQSLDILVVTSLVEGVPMPPLEALACGVSVVIPQGVGLLDELPDVDGIYRYEAGNLAELKFWVADAAVRRPFVDREALRAVTEPYTVDAWCEGHARAFEEVFGEKVMLNGELIGTDEEITAAVHDAWPAVGTVLAWTRKRIPHIKRQIAPYQGAVLAYYAHRQDRPGARFLEIGTALGYSACLMATAAPHASIITLNPKGGEFEKAVANLKIRSTVEVVKKTSVEFAQQEMGGGTRDQFDLVFVDGDHSYKMVLFDSQFFNRLRPGGVILFHDYSPDGSARPSDGSFKALNELQEKQRPADIKVIGTGQVGMLGWIRREGEWWA